MTGGRLGEKAEGIKYKLPVVKTGDVKYSIRNGTVITTHGIRWVLDYQRDHLESDINV